MLELIYYGTSAVIKERVAANANVAMNWDLKLQAFHDRGNIFILLKRS